MKSGGKQLSRYWWLVFLVTLSSVFLAASECEQTSDHTQTPTPLPSVGQGQVFHATKDGWDITVTSVKRETGDAEADQLLVGVHAVNTGRSAHSLGPNRFKLHDALGRTWNDVSYEAAPGAIDLSLQKVQPGLSTDLGLNFLIPTGAEGLWLETIGGGHIVLE